MIDGYMASKIARMEHEERVRALARVDDYDVWLTHTAGHWQCPRIGGWLSSLGTGLVSLRERLKHKHEGVLDGSLATQERRSLPD